MDVSRKLKDLEFEADLAAYQVLGAARVLFLMVSDEQMKKSGLSVLAKYDAARAAVAAYTESDEYKIATTPHAPDAGSYEEYRHIKQQHSASLRDNNGQSAEQE